MNLDFVIDKNTCFYYWVQGICGWDPMLMDKAVKNYLADAVTLIAEEQNEALNNVCNILKSSEDPRMILRELYSGDIVSDDSKKIVKVSKLLVQVFEPVWKDSLKELEKWQEVLRSIDLSVFDEDMKRLVYFFDSSFDINKLCKVYIVQNKLDVGTIGLTIAGSSSMIVRPTSSNKDNAISSTLSVIVHEYIHMIERESRVSRELFKKSFEDIIKNYHLDSLDGYSWNMMYVEAIVYVFTNNINLGYFSEKIHGTKKPSIEEMKPSFEKMVQEKRHNSNHVISWVALNILPEVSRYIEEDKQIDRDLANLISHSYLDFYLT